MSCLGRCSETEDHRIFSRSILLEKEETPLNIICSEWEAEESGSRKIPSKDNNDILLDSAPCVPSVSCQSNFPADLRISTLEGIIVSIFFQRVNWGIEQQQRLPPGKHSSGKVSRTQDSEIGGIISAWLSHDEPTQRGFLARVMSS